MKTSPNAGVQDDPDGLVKAIYDNMAEIFYDESRHKEGKPWPHAMPSETAMRGANWYHFPKEGSADDARCIHCLV